jgi:succinylglutamate desuccinylase
MLKKILFSCCTHGDEKIGHLVLEKFDAGKNDFFEWQSILSNPKAYQQNTRFVDQDLNRSFPGSDSPDANYEQKRAFEISKIIQDFDFVIDFHQTTAVMDDVIFINSENPAVMDMCEFFEAPNVVILNSSFGGKNRLLIDMCEGGIAIEYHRSSTADEEERILKDVENLIARKKSKVKKSKYQLIGKVPMTKNSDLNWQNFQELSQAELNKLDVEISTKITAHKPIFPIFIGEKAYPDTYCSLVALV